MLIDKKIDDLVSVNRHEALNTMIIALTSRKI